MKYLLNTHFHLALDNLRQNRGRTFLSALGIAIGVASIVLIMSLTGGVNNLISASSSKNNANLILVRPSFGKAENSFIDGLTNSRQFSKSNLTIEDVKTIKKVKTVADSELPKGGKGEKVSVKVLSSRDPIKMEIQSESDVVVSGDNVTTEEDADVLIMPEEKPKAPAKKTAKKTTKKKTTKKKGAKK